MLDTRLPVATLCRDRPLQTLLVCRGLRPRRCSRCCWYPRQKTPQRSVCPWTRRQLLCSSLQWWSTDASDLPSSHHVQQRTGCSWYTGGVQTLQIYHHHTTFNKEQVVHDTLVKYRRFRSTIITPRSTKNRLFMIHWWSTDASDLPWSHHVQQRTGSS